MLLFFEDGVDDIVLKVQNLIRSVTHIDYMEMPQFETQSTSSALEIRENQRRVFCYGQEILLTKTEYEILLYLYKNANMYWRTGKSMREFGANPTTVKQENWSVTMFKQFGAS